MNLFGEALRWIGDGSHWGGPGGIDTRIVQHLWVTFAAVGIAAVLAIPLGVLIGHTGRGRLVVVALAGAVRAVPTLGLLTLLGLAIGIGVEAPLLALVALAFPSLLAGAYAGIEAADPGAVDAARAVGMSEWQVVTRVEVPLGASVLIGGIRAATLQVVATATLAAYISDTGLGRYLFSGLKSRDYAQMLAGALLVAALALLLDLLMAALQRASSPTQGKVPS
ncbi:ABC transporter permease subunit [Pimelobacter simplex]|uniref:ABC transporter permease subunit n=1 Tax=Nocardioides simplex TaxID=2045 RepID=A0A0A1DKB4_NOCSI|nr:ABC transporter permease subunit [Pimelobacter simplex]AIY16988.1 Glycine betaine ABC transport system permease protein [Pimelobacter simplex]KAB2808972.1 ABC transporter permease subunit [Pimelobacter simplex]MCG8152157.1 ABC transporter permease subunit [Pimelobacter simplex]SFM52466.1 osmoprotectant transport system permease protein [Pimelobacter simplex]GEB12906.1 ABC transporter permease [Pimelobacter simplex]